MAGKPLVGVVPAWQVEKLSQKRAEILALLDQSWERNRAVNEDEVNRAVSEAVKDLHKGEKNEVQADHG